MGLCHNSEIIIIIAVGHILCIQLSFNNWEASITQNSFWVFVGSVRHNLLFMVVTETSRLRNFS